MSQSFWVELLHTPLDVAPATAYVSDVEEAGGVCVFLGTTRSEQSPTGQDLLALDYEAYPEMALKQLQQLAHDAQARWPVLRVAILHRLGRVAISQASVLIAVACPHRAEAFEACRWIIDTLKKDVAIWKKEVWADGSGTWVHPET
jgi:molybdopterin synthase catalytic subunit